MASNYRKLAEARILAAKLLPYMRHSVMSLVPVESPGLNTMAMDEYGRLYYDRAFLDARDLKHCAFVALHEDLHFHCRHPRRRVAVIGLNPSPDMLEDWRNAVDASVNDILEHSGLKCPAEGITPAKLGLPANKTPEEYYDILRKRRKEAEEKARQAAQEQAEQEEAQEQEDTAQDNTPAENDPQDGQGDAQDESPSDDTTEAQDEVESQEGDKQGDGEGDNSQDGEAGEDNETGDGDGESDSDSDASEQDGREGEGSSEGSGEADGRGEAEGQPDPAPSASEIGGSCMDGVQRPWELGPPTEENPGLAEHEQNLIEAATAQAIEQHVASCGRGSVSAPLAKQAGDLLHKPADPTKELAARVKYCVDTTCGFGEYTYARPNNRQIPGGCMIPSSVKPIPRVTVIIDTSGSMQKNDLALALDILAKTLRNLPDPRGLRVLVGGTRVEAAKNVFRKEHIELLEGGGTDMAALIVAAANERPEPKAIIVVTDTETGWPHEEVRPKVLVCATRKSRWMAPPPDWITTVYLRPEDNQ
jgi:predicted metal-dependent peptidase